MTELRATEPEERRLIRQFAKTADLIVGAHQSYLLVPVSPEVIDYLAAIDADAEDMEDDDPQEDDDPSGSEDMYGSEGTAA